MERAVWGFDVWWGRAGGGVGMVVLSGFRSCGGGRCWCEGGGGSTFGGRLWEAVGGG